MVGDSPADVVLDLNLQRLDVYESRIGWWHPEHGDLNTPPEWTFLPSGDAFVTRQVKGGGLYWLAWLPRSRTRRHRRLIGLLAPEATVLAALQAGRDSEAARAHRRESGARSRERQESRYLDELRVAIVAYLAFTPEYVALAESIATEAAQRAAVVGSGRVGRTRVLPLEERAALAARAQIRHAHTDYHQSLDEVAPAGNNDELYRQIKADAHVAVDAFLVTHRASTD